MPEIKKLIKIISLREKLVESAPREFIDKLEQIQNNLYGDLLNFVKEMNTTAAGNIVNNDFNKRITGDLRGQIRKWLRQRGYYAAITDLGKEYNNILKLAKKYYSNLGLDPAFGERDLNILSQIRKRDMDFLMSGDLELMNTTYDEVMTSVFQKTDWRDLAGKLKNLQTDVIIKKAGREIKQNGLLKKYANTYAFTSFASFDRQVQNIKTAQFGLNHFLYSGGLLTDSREFCAARVGKIFTKEQIDKWQDMDWKGKATGRDVWKFLGGWNCIHILSPVTAEFAGESAELEKAYNKLTKN